MFETLPKFQNFTQVAPQITGFLKRISLKTSKFSCSNVANTTHKTANAQTQEFVNSQLINLLLAAETATSTVLLPQIPNQKMESTNYQTVNKFAETVRINANNVPNFSAITQTILMLKTRGL